MQSVLDDLERAAAAYPGKIAFEDDKTALTWGELMKSARRLCFAVPAPADAGADPDGQGPGVYSRHAGRIIRGVLLHPGGSRYAPRPAGDDRIGAEAGLYPL